MTYGLSESMSDNGGLLEMREDTMGLLGSLAQGSAEVLQGYSTVSTGTSMPESMAETWMRDLAENSSDPVRIGKECIEVCGTEFDACLRFLREDLAFLQRYMTGSRGDFEASVLADGESLLEASGSVLSSGPRPGTSSLAQMAATVDGMPRQVTETCLKRGSKLLRLWRTEHRILYLLLERYGDERANFEREADPNFVAALEHTNNILRKNIQERDNQIEELQTALSNCNEILDALAAYNDAAGNDEDFALLRREIAQLQPSGVIEALERLLEHMRKITGPRRQRLAREWSETGQEADVPERQSSTQSSASGGSVRSRTEAQVAVAGELADSDAGAEEQLGNGVPEPERNDLGQVVVVGGSEKRRASVCIQDNIENNVKLLDDLQQSQFMANWLTTVDHARLKHMIMALDEDGQRSLVASLMESAADGRATNFIREVLRQLNSSRDRVDLVLEFVQMLDSEELDMITPTLIKKVTSKRLFESMKELGPDGDDNEESVHGANSSSALDRHHGDLEGRLDDENCKLVQTDIAIPMYDHPGEEARHIIIQAIKDKLESDEVPLSPSTVLTLGTDLDLDYPDAALDELEDTGSAKPDNDSHDQHTSNDKDGDGDSKDEKVDDENCTDKEDEYDDSELVSRPSSGGTQTNKKDKRKPKKMKKLDTVFNTVDIRNKSLLREGGELAMMVTLRRIHAKYITPLLNEALPWEKYLHRPPKHRRARKIEPSQLQDVIIGEVYQKKVQSDKMRREAGRKPHSLAKTILHFFTQKYGLKKLAEEYLYGVVQAIREDCENSPRVRLFGMLVGVVDPEHYSQTLCDVIMAVISVIFPRIESIAKTLEHGPEQTVVQSTHALRAARSIFKLVDGDVNRSGAEEDPDEDSSTRSWPMPSAFRQRLIKWVETNSVPESEVDKSTTSDIKVVKCDDFLGKVAQVFLSKVELDRTMMIQLFRTFDVNGDGVLSFEEFQGLLRTAQPQPPLDETQVMDLWIEVNDHEDDDDDDIITPEAFATICIRRNIELPYWKYDNENIMLRLVKQLEESI
ncbi:Hypothetical Protein FCC1311_031042 [Hondaea fermentalgiana]|uniref:EF-hand domain-containing protein n=1 Tax=Hondaea fermentalgiana TaxID=2315210 RepID=A0A2R5G752_9STRA|nr:Hypothetical Protein FCC1311_031042 [Hondaea fermentalgiana]|eukprot:GBG26882.1 Hypothetical Protein FCC1311_031042 [Hondaea fermentalgiana]